jgi:hypothetical protein
MRRSILVIGFAAFAATQSRHAQAPAPSPPAPCDAIGNVQFICGQNGPEDLVVVPGSQWVGRLVLRRKRRHHADSRQRSQVERGVSGVCAQGASRREDVQHLSGTA